MFYKLIESVICIYKTFFVEYFHYKTALCDTIIYIGMLTQLIN